MTRDHGEKAGIRVLGHRQALTRPRTMSLGALTFESTCSFRSQQQHNLHFFILCVDTILHYNRLGKHNRRASQRRFFFLTQEAYQKRNTKRLVFFAAKHDTQTITTVYRL
jgi:hypothetical protein